MIIRDFRINEYITLKLEDGETNIFVKGKRFDHCKFLLLNAQPFEGYMDKTNLDEIESIDQIMGGIDFAVEEYGLSYFQDEISYYITPEEEFWGYCSNIQVWAENDYDTNFLYSTFALNLLKKLMKAGDPTAKNVFKQEVKKRFDLCRFSHSNLRYLLRCGYFDYFTPKEKEDIIIHTMEKGNLYELKIYIEHGLLKNLNSERFYPILCNSKSDLRNNIFKGLESDIETKFTVFPIIEALIKMRLSNEIVNEFFKEAIIKIFETGNLEAIRLIILRDFLKIFNNNEMKFLFYAKNDSLRKNIMDTTKYNISTKKLAFPILRKLVEMGDKDAKNVLNDIIIKKIEQGGLYFKIDLFGDEFEGMINILKYFSDSYHGKLPKGSYSKDFEHKKKKISLSISSFYEEKDFLFFIEPNPNSQSYSSTDVIVFVYNTSNLDFINKISEYIRFVKENLTNVLIILIGSNLNLENPYTITRDKGIQIAREHDLLIFTELSLNKRQNINNIFESLIESLIILYSPIRRKFPKFRLKIIKESKTVKKLELKEKVIEIDSNKSFIISVVSKIQLNSDLNLEKIKKFIKLKKISVNDRQLKIYRKLGLIDLEILHKFKDLYEEIMLGFFSNDSQSKFDILTNFFDVTYFLTKNIPEIPQHEDLEWAIDFYKANSNSGGLDYYEIREEVIRQSREYISEYYEDMGCKISKEGKILFNDWNLTRDQQNSKDYIKKKGYKFSLNPLRGLLSPKYTELSITLLQRMDSSNYGTLKSEYLRMNEQERNQIAKNLRILIQQEDKKESEFIKSFLNLLNNI